MTRNVPLISALYSWVLLPLAAGLAGCATSPAGVERYSAPPVGATWKYVQKNSGSYGKDVEYTVTRADGDWQGRRGIFFKSSRGTTTFANLEDGKLVAVLGPDGKEVSKWEPPILWDYPLVVGQQWSKPIRMTVQGGARVLTFDWSCAVSSYGDTTVAAGTFKAVLVNCRNTIGTYEAFWYSPAIGNFVKMSVRRDGNSPFGVGTQETELVAYSAPPS